MKKKVGILYGGKSGEHEISLLSGAAVLRAIDKTRFIPLPIGVDKDGAWFILDADLDVDSEALANEQSIDKIATIIEAGEWKSISRPFAIGDLPKTVDIVFPAIHGTNGEDGKVQGLLESLGVPYAGCGVLASAICMDKAMAKEIFRWNDIPTCRYFLVHASDIPGGEEAIIEKSEDSFSYPVFVKPANGGSSLGISKVLNREEFKRALRLAAEYDNRILVEEAIDAREIEVAVIGNKEIKVATCGEIVAADDHRYYDYDAKYSDDSGTMLIIPADIPDSIMEETKELARRAYRETACEGFARVDTFWDRRTGRVLVNEINTIPGLTKYSLFPRLWECVGVSFTDLITEILELGYERCDN